MIAVSTPGGLVDVIGQSDTADEWFAVDQARIDAFAESSPRPRARGRAPAGTGRRVRHVGERQHVCRFAVPHHLPRAHGLRP